MPDGHAAAGTGRPFLLERDIVAGRPREVVDAEVADDLERPFAVARVRHLVQHDHLRRTLVPWPGLGLGLAVFAA